MYLLGALRFFQEHPDQVRPVAYEIAILGRNGLDINDPAEKYTLKTMPGTFSGLHLLAFMYAGFQKLDRSLNAGIDFSREYEHARQLLESKG